MSDTAQAQEPPYITDSQGNRYQLVEIFSTELEQFVYVLELIDEPKQSNQREGA